MSRLLSLLALLALTMFISCSSISKKDCSKNMMDLGLTHGRSGSQKNYLEDVRKLCSDRNPTLDLEAYQKGFETGWTEFCLPHKGFEIGKRGDRYISFCPKERESQFREKYLVGKRVFELKDTEEEMVEKMEELKPTIETVSTDFDDYNKIKLELESVKRELQVLEVEGIRDTFKFR